MNEDTKKKISESAKGRCAHNKGKKELIKHVYYTDGNISIRIPINLEPPEGFVRGRIKRKLSEEEKLAFNEKRNQTNIERYGNANYNNMEKSKQTKFNNHGNENYNNRDQAKLTCIEKYGVDNPSKASDVKLKIAQTNFNRRGISYSFQDRDVLLKAILNSTSDECAKQRMETCIKKYGVPYAGILFGTPNARDSKNNLLFKLLLIESNLFVDDVISREVTVDRFRYDFKVDDTLIEINPSSTHNSTYSIYSTGNPKPKEYHYQKAKIARDNNYKFIAIWDWDDINKILRLLLNKERVYARKCIVKLIDKDECDAFLNAYHLQGSVRSSINIGLYYDKLLISVMTFGNARYNKNYQYELLRYCSSKLIIGGAEKLFKFFVRNYNPSSIISYCDLSKFTGNVYLKLGFNYKSCSIGRHWYNESTKKHITDNLLRQRGFDLLLGDTYGTYGKGTSNDELMLTHGFVEIYDCGQAVYEWRN